MIEKKLQDEIEKKFAPKKNSSLVLSDVYRYLGFDSRFLRVSDCGSFLEFHVTDTDKKLHSANFCRDRLCPMCNWRRSLKIFGQVSRIMDVLAKDYQFLFLTLTVKNCSAEDFPATVQVLFDGWRFMYNKSKPFRSGVICGSFRSLEVTRNKKDGSFHPHLHCILAVKPSYFHKDFITQADWTSLWRSSCDLDYQPIVDVRKVNPHSEKGLSGAVSEVAKYAVKSSDFLTGSMSDMSSFVRTFLAGLTGRRLCSFTGCFQRVRRDLALDDVEDGDLVHVEADQLRDDVAYMVVRYGWRSGVYVVF